MCSTVVWQPCQLPALPPACPRWVLALPCPAPIIAQPVVGLPLQVLRPQPQGLQCRAPWLLAAASHGDCGHNSPSTPSWKPPCLALSCKTHHKPCQKRSFPLHCSSLVSPTHCKSPAHPWPWWSWEASWGWQPAGLQKTWHCHCPNQPKNLVVASEHELKCPGKCWHLHGDPNVTWTGRGTWGCSMSLSSVAPVCHPRPHWPELALPIGASADRTHPRILGAVPEMLRHGWDQQGLWESTGTAPGLWSCLDPSP